MGTLRSRASRRVTLLIVAGWGACLVPFAFAPAAATVVCFAVGGLIYGPFTALTYALFQSITTTANLPSVLAARSAALIVAAPLGMAIGGPIVASLRRPGDAERFWRRNRFPRRRGNNRLAAEPS